MGDGQFEFSWSTTLAGSYDVGVKLRPVDEREDFNSTTAVPICNLACEIASDRGTAGITPDYLSPFAVRVEVSSGPS